MPADFTLRISVLKDFVEAIGAAGEAIKHLTDGFAYLIRTAVSAYDQIKARIVYNHLKELSGLATSLSVGQIKMQQALEDYADGPPRDEESSKMYWDIVLHQMEVLFKSVTDLLELVEQNCSDFILQPAYAKLMKTLGDRLSLLQKLREMQAPNTPEELALVKKSAQSYRVLIEQLQAARDELNNYLLSMKN